jgi:hypothetical protein
MAPQYSGDALTAVGERWNASPPRDVLNDINPFARRAYEDRKPDGVLGREGSVATMDHAAIAWPAVEPSDLLPAWIRAEADCGRALNAWRAAKSRMSRAVAYAAYRDALDHEEEAAQALAAHVRGIER